MFQFPLPVPDNIQSNKNRITFLTHSALKRGKIVNKEGRAGKLVEKSRQKD